MRWTVTIFVLMFSYWEQECFLNYDHIVAGGGIVGLSTAIELTERYPTARVLVLERGLLPAGASTRNAGFACMGSATELLDDLKTCSEAETVALFAARKAGLQLLRHRLGDDRIGYKEQGSYELISEKDAAVLNKLDDINKLLWPAAGKDAFVPANERIAACGFSPAYAHALIENTCEGALHTGKMMRALTDMALHKGVEIKTGAAIDAYYEEENRVAVCIKDPLSSEVWQLGCSTFTICTNAFVKQLMPDAEVTPGRGQVLITQPVTGLKFKGIYHFDKGYYYFREIDGRVLFGGGRNIDRATEETNEIELNRLIQIDLEQKLADIILPGIHFQVAQRWAGIMAFGPTKSPVIQSFSDRVFGAFRMGGMGIALGSIAASKVVEMIGERY